MTNPTYEDIEAAVAVLDNAKIPEDAQPLVSLELGCLWSGICCGMKDGCKYLIKY